MLVCWGGGGGVGVGGGAQTQISFYCQILAHHGKNKGHRLLYITITIQSAIYMYRDTI